MDTCVDCVGGKFAAGQGNSDETECDLCPAGKFSYMMGSDSEANCLHCVSGKYSITEGSTSEWDCQDCVAGKYGIWSGVSACRDCAAGKYGSMVGSTSSDSCMLCPTYVPQSPPGSTSMSMCWTFCSPAKVKEAFWEEHPDAKLSGSCPSVRVLWF